MFESRYGDLLSEAGWSDAPLLICITDESLRIEGELPHAAGGLLLNPLVTDHISILSSIPAYAEWVAVEKDYLLPGLETVYVDPESIRSSGVITECASQAILFCASLNPFQILNIMDLFN